MNLSLQKNLFGLDIQELTTIIEQAGEPAYRPAAVSGALRRATDLAGSNLYPAKGISFLGFGATFPSRTSGD